MDNDHDIIQQVLTTYLNDYSGCEQKIQQLNQQASWSELYLFAHSLKGVLNGFGENAVIGALERIEIDTQNNQPPAKEDINLLCDELTVIEQQIHQYLVQQSQ